MLVILQVYFFLYPFGHFALAPDTFLIVLPFMHVILTSFGLTVVLGEGCSNFVALAISAFKKSRFL